MKELKEVMSSVDLQAAEITEVFTTGETGNYTLAA
jgi:hypothetical protein